MQLVYKVSDGLIGIDCIASMSPLEHFVPSKEDKIKWPDSVELWCFAVVTKASTKIECSFKTEVEAKTEYQLLKDNWEAFMSLVYLGVRLPQRLDPVKPAEPTATPPTPGVIQNASEELKPIKRKIVPTARK